jgi:hypothetical protein
MPFLLITSILNDTIKVVQLCCNAGPQHVCVLSPSHWETTALDAESRASASWSFCSEGETKSLQASGDRLQGETARAGENEVI